MVDGYEAVRSGPTVYVNVANVVDTTGNGLIDTLYTNIYMISSTDDSTQDTKEIFSQILDNWKFNTNIISAGFCKKETNKSCVYDSDCPVEDYCAGEKARIIRDVKRLSDAVLIKEALEEYKQKNNHYPILASGSYLPNVSISAWPSWSEAFSRELGKQVPKDPLNILGDCPGYNEKTCWNEVSKEFVTDIKAGIIPNYSNVYLYLTDHMGSSYNYCFASDSGYINGNGGACLNAGNFGFGGEAGNRQPVFAGTNLSTAYSGDFYSGFIQAFDADGDAITWSIDTTLSSWAGWSAPVQIKNTPILNQKEIYAAVVGPDGEYSFSLTINDGRGETNSITTTIFKIRVGNIPPELSFSDYTYTASSTNPLAYFLTAYDDVPGNMPLSYSLISGALFPGVVESFDGSIARYEMNGVINPAFKIPSTTNFPYSVKITDAFGASADANFTIIVINNSPIFISSNCENDTVRTGQTLNCTLKAKDPDGNFLAYSITFSTAGIPSVNPSTGVVNIGNLTTHGDHYFDYKIEDEYGAVITGRKNFTVTNFCGDNVKQSPNMEGRGGLSDSGFEQCDGTDGVARTIAESSATMMYSCTTPPECADSGSCLGACAFLSGPDGGYCGDGFVQDSSVIVSDFEECDFGSNNNCCKGCKWSCPSIDGYSYLNSSFVSDSYVNFSNGNTADFIIPSCQGVRNVIAKFEKKPSKSRTAIVFVTDNSGSMPSGMTNVKTAINDSLRAMHEAVLNNGADIHVGLVRFASGVSSVSIKNLALVSNLNSLITSVNSYNDSGSTYTKAGMESAQSMLNDFVADRKIIILLSDGVPNPSSQNPITVVNNLKSGGVLIYTVAYTTNGGLINTMCGWSSDTFCPTGGTYAFSSTNATGPYLSILNSIMGLPNNPINVQVGSANTSLSFSLDTISLLNLPPITCEDFSQTLPMTLNFSGNGSVVVSNIEVEYCPACESGSSFCGDGSVQYPNSAGGLELCDQADLGGQSCITQGYGGGTLSCSSACSFDITSCCEKVYGGWTNWSAWGSCSGGVETRTRTCTDPTPSCGGSSCAGISTDTRPCCVPTTSCPADICGFIEDGCGGNLNCGACSVGTCYENNCVCTPTPWTTTNEECWACEAGPYECETPEGQIRKEQSRTLADCSVQTQVIFEDTCTENCGTCIGTSTCSSYICLP